MKTVNKAERAFEKQLGRVLAKAGDERTRQQILRSAVSGRHPELTRAQRAAAAVRLGWHRGEPVAAEPDSISHAAA